MKSDTGIKNAQLEDITLMKCFSITPFRSVGSSVQTETPFICHDLVSYFFSVKPESGTIDIGALTMLRVNETSVVAVKRSGFSVTEGYRVTRLPEYISGSIMWDKQAKEYVMISNGLCVFDHSSPEGFARTHRTPEGLTGDCVFLPSDAVALRVFMNTEKSSNTIVWTYRVVNPCYLESLPLGVQKTAKVHFDLVMMSKSCRV